MTEFLLIRHGQTNWNIERKYTGQSDIPLNETGKAQARAAAAQLQADPPAAIYSSDLIRAYDTAQIIAADLDITVQQDARLREIHQGVWEGLHFDEIKARFANEFAAREDNPLEVAPPGGETVGQVQERVLQALAEIIRAHPDGRVAIVSHGLTLAVIKAHALGKPIQQVWDLIPKNAVVESVFINPR